MKRFIMIMMMTVLGTFVVKGFTSVCPTIKTDGIEFKSDYSCDQVHIVSTPVIISELNIVTDVGNYVVKSYYAINNTNEKEIKFERLEIDYLPDLNNKNTFCSICSHNPKKISGRNGSMPSINTNIILATDKNIRV